MKKRKVLLLMMIMLVLSAFAQPTTITWQGKLLDSGGNAITVNNVALSFAIFDDPTAGNQLWPASGLVTKTVNVIQGLYSVPLGTGTGEDIAFTADMFDGKTPWLEVKVGTETLPRTEITMVPFALISNDLSAQGWENPGTIGKTTPNTGKFISVETGSVRITAGAGDGKVLSSDAAGDAAWETLTPVDIGAAEAIHSHSEATTSTAGFLSTSDKIKLNAQTTGTAIGQMQYWNGTSWINLPAGQPGQVLLVNNSNIPVWTSIGLPRLSTSAATTITSSTATSGGIVNNFGESVTERGVCWNTSPVPTIALTTKTSNGSGTGAFTSSITGLEPNTLYYVKAFATCNSGTYYGDEIVFTSNIAVGDNYGGGVVAYVLQSGDPGYSANVKHGFIAAAEDQTTLASWGCQGTAISGADGSALGTGAQNTLDIVAGCATAGIAARICNDLVLNSYDDWYLPSKEELRKLYLNSAAIGGFNFFTYSYWSSSEYDNNNVWQFNKTTGSLTWVLKNPTARFRPVRTF